MIIRTINSIRYLTAIVLVILSFLYLGQWLIVPFLGLIFGAVLVSAGPVLMCLIIPDWKWTSGVVLVLSMMLSSTLHLRYEPTFTETVEAFFRIATSALSLFAALGLFLAYLMAQYMKAEWEAIFEPD